MKLLAMAIGLLVSGGSLMADAKVTLAPHSEPRRYVLAEHPVTGQGPFEVKDAADKLLPADTEIRQDGSLVRWLIRDVPANQAPTYTIAPRGPGAKQAPVLSVVEKDGSLSVTDGNREITRYNFGPAFTDKFKKPFFYPVNAHGLSMTRSFPMEKKDGEETDHPHHTGVYFAHGEVNGKEYWSKLPIHNKRIVKMAAGDAAARIVAENVWGEEILERQDVLILNTGDDVVMDWTITMTAPNMDVHLGKTKEGGFSVRVPQGLTSAEPGKDKSKTPLRGDGLITDSLGNAGEPKVRENFAPWMDYTGRVEGKTVGVAMMNHPTSWRYPTGWHVRNYGLAAANAFFVQGEHHLKKGESITLKYRVYFHAGDPKDGKVAEVWAGYANAAVKGE
jgi:hypothetical protein